MKNCASRSVVCLGVLAGSLAIATAAQAQIPVTGGRVTGDAAFFVPGVTSPSGSPVLFDTAIKTLRIVTPNGTSTTSRFIPNAASFTDTNGNNLPDRGDTGRLVGTLSGVAFSTSGNPVFFQGVPTDFRFTLNSFDPVLLQGGTLISPKEQGAAPLVFLPVAPITLSSRSSNDFSADRGLLSVGPFSADLTGDRIGLPSDLQFRSSGDVTVVPVVLGRRIKFDFEGRNVLPDSTSFDGNTLAFTGPTTSFKVQSVGTPGTREFKIEGTIANLDIQLTRPFDIKRDSLDLSTAAGPLSYDIKGEGPGFVAFGNSSVSFTGTSRRDTSFKFEQGDRKFEGKSSGDTAFNLTTGVDDRVNFVPFVGVNNSGTEFNAVQTQTLLNNTTVVNNVTVSSTSTTTVDRIAFTNVVLNPSVTYIRLFNPSRLVVDRDDDDDDDDDRGRRRVGRSDDDDRDDDRDDDDDRGRRRVGRSDDDDRDDDDDDTVYGNLTYTIYRGSAPVVVVVERDRSGRIIFVERERGRGRALGQRRRVVAVYQEVGLPSRVFPGLVGLRQLPPESANTNLSDDNGDDATSETTSTPNTTTGTTTDSNTTPTP
ncbi:hypothetical protein J5X98_05650 [Leptothermofonsia sichuanensis E412]|uniref:hypothetical protein n=1 Tax=Leptothermofonsia sichuanensis TaxID=2917832 RepID=UPI001CA79CFA|nr:hypothetical protein [Leptothermofonsia sichuanensis]QZZ21911.1 hypothetical protein J5X98_05650 [Leptothermofonsia sichuanensis E412]